MLLFLLLRGLLLIVAAWHIRIKAHVLPLDTSLFLPLRWLELNRQEVRVGYARAGNKHRDSARLRLW